MSRSPGGTFRPDPARIGNSLVWPSDFGTRFTIFVDTEEEFDWNAPFDRRQRSTRAMQALPEAHRRFAERGVGLTFMVDHPIATSPLAVDILNQLLRDGRSAIGAQLHPWVNPPFDEEVNQHNSFSGNLPRTLERKKIEALTESIANAFAFQPLCYRAGRYGIGPDTVAVLREAGYRIDTSMRARYDYGESGGPDFSLVGNSAFRFVNTPDIVELPLTTVFAGRLRHQGSSLFPRIARSRLARSVAARTGLLSRIALTPEEMPLGAALEAVRIAVGEGVRLLNFSFHSPSVAPGYTPYVRDQADLAAFHRWWDAVFDLLDSMGIAPATHDEIVEALDRAG